MPHEELPSLIAPIHPTFFQEKLQEAMANLRHLEEQCTSHTAVTAQQITEWKVRAGLCRPRAVFRPSLSA